MNQLELLDNIKSLLTEKVGQWQTPGIAASGTVSPAVDLGGHYAYLQVVIPTITTAQLELQVSSGLTEAYQDLGQDALTTSGTGGFNDTWNLGGWRYIKIKASATQTRVTVIFQVRGITY